MTKNILITGFSPFLDYQENPSELLAKNLDKREINGYRIVSKILPVDFENAAKILIRHYEEIQPQIIISLGLAATREKLSIERIFINCNHSETDQINPKKVNEKIDPIGPDGLFTNLDLTKIDLEFHKNSAIPFEISNSAGTYVCNNIGYQFLNYCCKNLSQKSLPRFGFIHIPLLNSPKFPFSVEDISQCALLILQNITVDIIC